MRTLAFALCLLAAAGQAEAKVVGKVVKYKHGKVALEGYVAYDDAVEGKRPAVLVVHDWMGISDETRRRVDLLAGLGYVAFAADMYGAGIRPTTREDAAANAGKIRGDRKLMRARARAGLDTLRKHELADPARLAAMGYCFGGTVALELARSAAPMAGVVSFHGGLETGAPEDIKQFKGKVLVLHGADDPHVDADEVAAFRKEMRDAGVDWQLVAYGGAVHSFTNPNAGNDKSKGNAYDEKADRRSWEAMKDFFGEIFAAK